MASFRWLRSQLGLPFPVDNAVLADFKHLPVGHVPKQAEAMSPAMFVNVLALVHELSPLRAQEPLLVLFMAMACIRHQHLSVSTVTGNTDDFIFGRCPKVNAEGGVPDLLSIGPSRGPPVFPEPSLSYWRWLSAWISPASSFPQGPRLGGFPHGDGCRTRWVTGWRCGSFGRSSRMLAWTNRTPSR